MSCFMMYDCVIAGSHDGTAHDCVRSGECIFSPANEFKRKPNCTADQLAGVNLTFTSSAACVVCHQTSNTICIVVFPVFYLNFNSAQVQVFNVNGTLDLWRALSTGCDPCQLLSWNASALGYWYKCCTTDWCNNLPIPANVASLAALELATKYYLESTQAECYGASLCCSHICVFLELRNDLK